MKPNCLGYLETTVKSNCVVKAVSAFAREIKKGYEKGDEPYIWLRPSRFEGSPFHMGWGKLDQETGQMQMYSFKPKEPVDLPTYLAFLRLMFEGKVVNGDGIDH